MGIYCQSYFNTYIFAIFCFISNSRSPPHPHPAAKDAGNSTFDLDSEPNMSLVVEGARDETHSGISMIGPIEMNSSLDTDSKTSSPKQ